MRERGQAADPERRARVSLSHKAPGRGRASRGGLPCTPDRVSAPGLDNGVCPDQTVLGESGPAFAGHGSSPQAPPPPHRSGISPPSRSSSDESAAGAPGLRALSATSASLLTSASSVGMKRPCRCGTRLAPRNAPGAIRTRDLPLRRRLLYPTELPGLPLQCTALVWLPDEQVTALLTLALILFLPRASAPSLDDLGTGRVSAVNLPRERPLSSTQGPSPRACGGSGGS